MVYRSHRFVLHCLLLACVFLGRAESAAASADIPFSITLSEAVVVTGTPRIALDVGGVTQYATYASGSGTSTLTFTYTTQAGDVDLDGITVSSPIDLNGGTIKDLAGNSLSALTFTPPNTTGIKVNHPSLSLDFINSDYIANGTHYATLPSFLTATGGSFTRASVGTYFDSAGTVQTATSGTPRFDYDPVTHVAKGILIEESRTNRLINSANFNGAGWSRTDITVDNTSSYIYGLQLITEGSAGTASLRQNASSFTAGADVVGSFFISRGNTDWIVVKINEGGSGEIANFWFNLSTGTSGTISKTGGYNEIATITPVDTNVYRITVRFVPNPTATNRGFMINSASGNGSSTRVAGAQYYLSYAQLEQGTFATSYIPTNSTTATRAADVLKIPTGSWYNAVHGTMFVNVYDSRPAGLGIWASLGTTGNSDRCQMYSSGANMEIQNYDTSVAQVLTTGGTRNYGTNKAAYALETNNFAFVSNGGTVGTDTTGTIGTKTLLVLGRGADYSIDMLNDHINSFKYYPTRVNNTQLQLLTQ